MIRPRILLSFALLPFLLAGCGGGGSSNGGAATTETYIGDFTSAVDYRAQLTLRREGSSVSGTGYLLDSANRLDSATVAGTADGTQISLTVTGKRLGAFALSVTESGTSLDGTFAYGSGASRQSGSVSLANLTSKSVAALGVWSGTLLTPGETTPDAATLNVGGQSGEIASGFLSTKGLTLPLAFYAVEGTATTDVPGLGTITGTLAPTDQGEALAATLTVGANTLNVPAGVYRLDLTRQSSTPTVQMPGIWVGAYTPSGGGSSEPLQFQFDQTGTTVSGTALLYTGSALATGTISGTANGNDVVLSVAFGASSVGTIAFSGPVTAGAAYSGSATGGTFATVKTTQPILDLEGAWKGAATAGPLSVPVTMNLTSETGAMASGTMTIQTVGNPTSDVVIYAVPGNYTGATKDFAYKLTVSDTKIAGTVKVLSIETTFDVSMTRQ